MFIATLLFVALAAGAGSEYTRSLKRAAALDQAAFDAETYGEKKVSSAKPTGCG